jgi:cobalt/nickel transport system ATP-binding protein
VAAVNDHRQPWALEARDIEYAYPGGIAALCGVSFRARCGELVAVLGANGSGKTTLLKVLMRLVQPQRGQVLLGQLDARGLKPADIYRRVGMVFQNPSDQLFAATVEQDVTFGPANLGLPPAEIAARTGEALEAVDGLEFRDRPIHDLSFGQQKRVCLAGVLAMRPPILLLDEPTAGLDPAGESQMAELLLRLRRRQATTIVVCTHAVDLLPVLADRVYVLRHGRVWREGPAEQVLCDPPAMAAAGLRLPLVAQLFHDLACRHGIEVPRLTLTLADARRRILELLALPDPAKGPRDNTLDNPITPANP